MKCMYKISNFDLIKNQLNDLESEVSSSELSKNIPQLIDTANLLRENEVLKKINEKKSHLLDAYLSYVDILEQLLDVSKPITKKRSKKTRNFIINKNTRKRSPTKNTVRKTVRKPKKKARRR